MSSWVMFLLIGGAAGLVGGFFGMGGGIIIVPALIYWAGFSQQGATGTSLATLLLPVGLGAAFEYYRHGNVDLRASGLLAVSMFIGAWGGAVLTHFLKESVLRLAFGVFVFIVGIFLIYGACKRLGWI